MKVFKMILLILSNILTIPLAAVMTCGAIWYTLPNLALTKLGLLISNPIPVSGGLLHRMYHVTTNLGEYAFKVLNPEVMKRPEAMRNMINSERIADKLKERVSLIAAIGFNGQYVLEADGAYFMVYDWQEGESVFAPELTAEHCAQIGKILGRIHVADIKVSDVEAVAEMRELYSWEYWLEQAKGQNIDCYTVLLENITNLHKWDKAVHDSRQELLKEQVISHRDLDPKNVLWQDDVPYIIDWESAGFVNPYQELIEVLNYWIIDENGRYDKKKFDALIQSYAVRKDIMHVNWKAVLNGGFEGMLGWLDYSLKRTLFGENAAEKEEGFKQVIDTINSMNNFETQSKKMYAWIVEFMEV